LSSSHDIGKHQTAIQSDVIKITKETGEEQFDSLSDGGRILGAEEDIPQSPVELTDTQSCEKDDWLNSVSRNQSTRPRVQRGRKVLMREVSHISRSVSVDDMKQIASCQKTHEGPRIPYWKQFLNISKIPDEPVASDEKFSGEGAYRLHASKHRGITSKSQSIAQRHGGKSLQRQSSASRISALATRTTQEHISALHPSFAYLPSLQQPSSNQPYLRSPSLISTSRNNSLSTQRTDNDPILPLSRQTLWIRTLRSSIYSSSKGTPSSASSLWPPTSEETDIYRVNILSNLHFCTCGYKEKSSRRNLDRIQHEEQIHKSPIIHTYLLHVSVTLSSDPCPVQLCVSTLNVDHLAQLHNSLS
jgi:hypothetical protein